MRRPIHLLFTLAAVWAVASSIYFLVPQDDPLPARADAVVVLAGDAKYRIPAGLDLVRAGRAPVLALSREPGGLWRGRSLCAGGTSPKVVCFQAAPYSTRGEARAVARLARAHGWRSIVVVTSEYHVRRAQLLFDRCLDGLAVAFDGADYARRWIPLDLAYETAKLVRAQIQRSC